MALKPPAGGTDAPGVERGHTRRRPRAPSPWTAIVVMALLLLALVLAGQAIAGPAPPPLLQAPAR